MGVVDEQCRGWMISMHPGLLDDENVFGSGEVNDSVDAGDDDDDGW